VAGSGERTAGHDVGGRPLLLVIDPEPGAESLVRALAGRLDVRRCASAAEGLLAAGSLRPHVVLASAAVGDVPCRTVVELLRRCSLPVVVSADREHGELAGAALAAGAAACIPAPYRPEEILALVRLLAAPPAAPVDPPIRCGALALDPMARTVTLRGDMIDMAPQEFRLLHYLMTRQGTVVSRDELWAAVWHGSAPASSNTVSVHVRRLRRRLDDDPARPAVLTTVGKSGYRLLPVPETDDTARAPGSTFTAADRVRAS
jgi:DNA-binding response OmpR family regulator